MKIPSCAYTILAFVKQNILGLKGSSTQGSDLRRFAMRLCLFWSTIFFFGAFSFASEAQVKYSVGLSIAAFALIATSLLVFFQIVLLMPFRDDGDDFVLDAWRLVKDTIISSIFMILAFSLLYKNIGLISNDKIFHPNTLDAIYFSSVTFSTLGYGDFAPSANIRIIAAAQALLGNLHLGMIVGATLAAIRR